MVEDMEIDLNGGEKPSAQSVAPTAEQLDEHAVETEHGHDDLVADANDLESSRALMLRTVADLVESAIPAVKGISALVPFAKKYLAAETEEMIEKIFKRIEVQFEYRILEVLVKGGLVEPEVLTVFTQQANLKQKNAAGPTELDVSQRVLDGIGLDKPIG